MDLEERQRQRSLNVLKEAQAAIAEADQVLAKANAFFNGPGLELKNKLEALPAEERERIHEEAQQALRELQKQASQSVQRKMFEQHQYGYKPSGGRRLV